MRTVGCPFYATKPTSVIFPTKYSPAIFMRYSSTQKGYRLLDIESGKFFVNRDVIFKKTIFPFKYPNSQFLSSSNTTLVLSSYLSLISLQLRLTMNLLLTFHQHLNLTLILNFILCWIL